MFPRHSSYCGAATSAHHSVVKPVLASLHPVTPRPHLCSVSSRPDDMGLFMSLRDLDQQIDQQFRASESAFTYMNREFEDMATQMDRDMARMRQNFDMRQFELQSPDDGGRSWRGSFSSQSSQGYSSSYSHVSVEVRGNLGGWVRLTHTTPAISTGPSPLLLLALLGTCAYTAVTVAFTVNYHRTLYKAQEQLRLTLTWPVLMLFSASFRHQFLAAVRGNTPCLSNAIEGGQAGDRS